MKLIKNAPVLIATTAAMNVTLGNIYPVGVYESKPTVKKLSAQTIRARALELLTPRDINFINMYVPQTKNGVSKVLMYMKQRRKRRAERNEALDFSKASVQVA